MKKRLIVILAVVCALALCLCACGGNGGGGQGGGGQQGGGEQGGGGAQVAGETIDTGLVKGLCPDGWMYYQQTDMWAEKDADGNYPADPTKMAFCKGGESEWDLFSKPTLYVNYYEGELTDSELECAKAFVDDVADTKVTVQGKECAAFTGKSLVDDENPETDYWENLYIFLPLDKGYFQINIPTHCGEEPGVSVDDADVQAIINSIAVD